MRLYPRFYTHFEPPRGKFITDKGKIDTKVEIIVRGIEAEIEVFRKTLKAMKNPHRCTSVERCMREEARATKTYECYFLDDLLEGIAPFITVFALVSIQHYLYW